MNDNLKVRTFLAQLRKFLPEKVRYMALSALPEDIFDFDDYLSFPDFSNDKEIEEFIDNNGFEDPDNLICFFMQQYMDNLNEMIDEMFDEWEMSDTNGIYDIDYSWIYAE